MNQNVENLLRAMPLAQPGAAMDRRIEEILTARPQRDGVFAQLRPWWMTAASLAAAAAIALMAHVQVQPTPTVPLQPFDDGPVVIEQQWSTFIDEGVVFVDGLTPGYAVRETVTHERMWIDERQDVRMSWTWPEQQVLIVPFTYQ